MTARCLREAIDLTEPEPRSLADFLGREERIERSLQYRRRHPGAGIAHRDHNIGPGCQLGVVGGVISVEGHVSGLDRDPPAARHRVPGIDDEIEHRRPPPEFTPVEVKYMFAK